MHKLLLIIALFFSCLVNAQVPDLSLNGVWEAGLDRNYTFSVVVPGITLDPSRMTDGKLWYKRTIHLPEGDWSNATLVLLGARFAPAVYVNGFKVSQKNGGMAPTFHLLKHKSVVPGKAITIEIALTSLRDLSERDASYIARADHWRSNISSSLWDDVYLHFHADSRIQRLVPYYDTNKKKIDIRCDFEKIGKNTPSGFVANIYDLNGNLLLTNAGKCSGNSVNIHFDYKNILTEWSPENPQLYRLEVLLKNGRKLIDHKTINIGIKEFTVKNKQCYLNGNPCKMRGGTVVWHRWVRSEEGRELGFNIDWFTENIVKRLKDHGANLLRFHLGNPPQRFLDLCDKYGLLVQYEWSFFHGMPASRESLMEQYPSWLNLAMEHPSVANYHPYNETEGDELQIVWSALDEILADYPTLVMEERDVIHIHKYWWSLFENVGIYYDNANQFDKAIMVDEFGGNYLDEKGDLGGYRSLKESNLRFLGRNNTADERLNFQAMTNARIGEYWRRIDAAGIAPFTILASWEDGNTWFMGKLSEGNPKPVWNALTALFAPQSVSLDIWDRNFLPGQEITVPLYFFNDTEEETAMYARVWIENKWLKIYEEQYETVVVGPYEKIVKNIAVKMPEEMGVFTIKAELLNRADGVKYSKLSTWEIRTFEPETPFSLHHIPVAVFNNEPELLYMLAQAGIRNIVKDMNSARLIVSSLNTWQQIAAGDATTKAKIDQAIQNGISVLLLDVGDRKLGQGYPEKTGDLGNLQGLDKVLNPTVNTYNLIPGVYLVCTQAAEPESHLHADTQNDALWYKLPREYTWLWNGYRGGLLMPASEIEISGLSKEAFLTQWKARGADVDKITSGNYYAYDLQGFYQFSTKENDADTIRKLKEYVKFLVEDAPALASSINPLSPVKMTNLSKEYGQSSDGKARQITVLANAGKNLTRTPVLMVDFGEGKGKMILSQLLTAGRLDKNKFSNSAFDVRYDPVAVQMVLNMMHLVINQQN